MTNTFAKNTFGKRFSSMLKVDFKRLFISRAFYIILAACLVAPILITVMTTMMDVSVSVNPQTGEESVMEGFDNAWQIIGSVSGGDSAASGNENGTETGNEADTEAGSEGGNETDTEAVTDGAAGGMAGMDMGLTTMCNINMLYFGIAALVCIFVSEDFISGYSKNLFTVRAKKTDYVASKTVVLIIGAMMMILAFIIGSVIGGAVSGLSFEMMGFDAFNLVMCFLSKMVLVSIFVPIYLVMSVVAKNKVWLSLILSVMVGMFLFMMIPMLTPLNATVGHVLICAVGGFGFSIGLGAISNQILKKTSLV